MDTIEETLKENIEEMLCYRFKVLELTPEIEDMSLEILNNIKTNLFNQLNNIKKMVEGLLPLFLFPWRIADEKLKYQ